MAACHRCGADNLPGSRFCSACGTRLRATGAGLSAERKVVTVVFADLVGFTGRAERLDPEDVGRLLQPFHARVRAELERHGGTVEKFIGDAVMAVFGAPVAHEDDPERAVRAAFAIRDALTALNVSDPELDLHIRIGIATGEAFVQLGADPGLGDAAVAGDVVNAAARLQQGAPVDAIVVAGPTQRATAGTFAYRALEPIAAKGKRRPVPAWEAVAPLSGDDARPGRRTPFVGRSEELDRLRVEAALARDEGQTRIVTLVGEPGLGKTRLAWELHEALAGVRVLWLQGRSLAYGGGVTFWALADVVKSHAGILETDSAHTAEERLERSVGEVVGGAEDRSWIVRHLRPLVGLGEEVDRRESFAAWRRYLHGIAAAHGLLVLCFEDLQWADEGMLDFIEHLVSWGEGSAVLVVCTARPELLEQRPDWPGVLPLSPLGAAEAVSLLGSLLAGVEVRGERWPALLAAAGGNPLYAEEYARLLRERQGPGELPLPDSVQGIVAARIDALPAEEKALLQDAAVVGRGFWPGALERLSGRDRGHVDRVLAELERRGLVEPVARSAIAGEPQHAFSHALVRDVAYGQIPHRERAGRHRLTADWIASLAPDRVTGTAEMTAHHYRLALDYARGARQATVELEERARLALRAAGDRALALGAYAAAAEFYESAAGLWARGTEELSRLRLALGIARFRAEGGGELELEQAQEELLALGDPESAAEADVLLAELRFRRGDGDGAFTLLERAVRSLEQRPASRQKALVLSTLSRFRAAEYEAEEAIAIGRQALVMGEQLSLEEIRAHALNNIGNARVTLGDRGGLADLEESVRIAAALGSVEGLRGYLNLGTALAHLGELERAYAVHAQGRKGAERFGDATGIRWFAVERLFEWYWSGRWDDAAAAADAFLAETDEVPDYYTELGARTARCWVRLGRGDLSGAEEDAVRYLDLGREAGYPQALFPALALGARVLAEAGRRHEAKLLVAELFAAWKPTTVRMAGFWTADLAFALCDLRGGAELLEAVKGGDAPTPWLEAAVELASGNPAGAADRYAAIGSLPDEACARLRAGDKRGLAFVRRTGATGYRLSSPAGP